MKTSEAPVLNPLNPQPYTQRPEPYTRDIPRCEVPEGQGKPDKQAGIRGVFCFRTFWVKPSMALSARLYVYRGYFQQRHTYNTKGS